LRVVHSDDHNLFERRSIQETLERNLTDQQGHETSRGSRYEATIFGRIGKSEEQRKYPNRRKNGKEPSQVIQRPAERPVLPVVLEPEPELGPTDAPVILLVRLFTPGSSSSILPFPSKTPWMSDIVLSRLLLLVLGLVIVVPKLACLEWPRLKPPGDGATGLPGAGAGGDCDPLEVLMRDKGWPLKDVIFSKPSATPFGEIGGGGTADSEGVVGWEDRIALPSSESASKSSGGKRSFSISDLRLLVVDIRQIP